MCARRMSGRREETNVMVLFIVTVAEKIKNKACFSISPTHRPNPTPIPFSLLSLPPSFPLSSSSYFHSYSLYPSCISLALLYCTDSLNREMNNSSPLPSGCTPAVHWVTTMPGGGRCGKREREWGREWEQRERERGESEGGSEREQRFMLCISSHLCLKHGPLKYIPSMFKMGHIKASCPVPLRGENTATMSSKTSD